MSNSNPVGPMVFLGTPEVGNTLTGRPNSIFDDDGINASSVSFQWLRNGEPIPGATGQFYTLQSADLNAEISVSYSYTDFGGTREVVTSNSKVVAAAQTPVTPTTPTPDRDVDPGYKAPGNTAPDGPMGILGDALVGETLTARPNAVRDADGIDYNTARYQWLRDGQEITGASNQTYVVTNADRGSQLSVEFTYTDMGGSFERVVSEPEPIVPGGTPTPPPVVEPPVEETPTPTPTPTPPVEPPVETPDDVPEHFGENNPAIGKLIIYGFPVLDAVLEARTSAVFDREGFDRDSGSYQWFRDGEPIPGATGDTYRITEADLGTSLSLQYSFVDFGGTTETMVSDPEPPVPFPDGMEPAEEPNEQGGEERTDQPSEGGETGLTTPEDDTVTITSDMSSVDGLAGTDTAVLAGDQTDYTVTLGPDGVTVTDRNADGLGTVELTNFEFLDFGTEVSAFDGPMDLTQFGGHTGLGEADFAAFVEMYIAYFNRAPDAIGLGFWGTSYANGMSLEEIASSFADQPETLATYPADSNSIRFTADVYANVLGRSPDIEGLRFWSDALDNGDVTRGEFILEVLRGVKADAPADATQEFIDRQAADLAYLEAKTDLGTHFAVTRGMSNVDDAAMVMALFDGSADSLAAAVDAADTLYTAAQDPVNGDFLMPLVGVLDDPFTV